MKVEEVDLKKYKEPKSRITTVLPTSVRNEIARRANNSGQTTSAYTAEKMIDACLNEDALKDAQNKIEELEKLLQESEEEKQNILVELEKLQVAPKVEYVPSDIDPDLVEGFKARINLLSMEVETLKQENEELKEENELLSQEVQEAKIEEFTDFEATEEDTELEDLRIKNQELLATIDKAKTMIFEEIVFDEYEEEQVAEIPFLKLLESALNVACEAYRKIGTHKREADALSETIDFVQKSKDETCRFIKYESIEAFKRALSYLSKANLGFNKGMIRKAIEAYLDENKQSQSKAISKYFDKIFNEVEANGTSKK